MKTKVNILLSLLTLISLAACQQGGGGGAADQKKSKPVVQPQPSDDKKEITPKKEVVSQEGIEINLSKKNSHLMFTGQRDEFIKSLNQYAVTIRVPLEIVDDIRIVKVDLDLDREEDLPTSSMSLEKGKAQLVENYKLAEQFYKSKKIAYKVYTQDRLLVEANFELIPDLYIKGIVRGSDLKLEAGNHRLVNLILDRNARFVTEGRDYNFTVRDFYSDNGFIETFQNEDLLSPLGVRGRDGGKVQIHADYAVGTLEVRMSGMRGGQGLPGLDNSQSERGKDGAPGVQGSLSENLDSCSDVNSEPPKSAYYKAAVSLNLVGSKTVELKRCHKQLYCSRQPTDGAPGENGVAGGNGFNGQRGGNSGQFILSYGRESKIITSVFTEAGDGGPGGVGGAGGPPGKGGAAGGAPRYDEAGRCRRANNGPDGKPGPTGQLGSRGEKGDEEKYCIFYTGKKNDCETQSEVQ